MRSEGSCHRHAPPLATSLAPVEVGTEHTRMEQGVCMGQMCVDWLGLEQEMLTDQGEGVEALAGASCPDFNVAS